MKKVTIMLLAVLLGTSGSSFAVQQSKYRAFTPSGAGKSVFVKSGAKQYKYFIVEKGTSFGFDVTGPTTVRIRTRAALNSDVKSANYEIQVWEGDQLMTGRKVQTSPSKLMVDNQNLGLARTVFVKVPKGRHSYRLWITSDKVDKYFVRFYRLRTNTAKSKFGAIAPYQFDKQVTLLSSKSAITYYLVNSEGGVSLNVVGPTKLKIYCHAAYSQTMQGRTKYTLAMYEDRSEVAQFPGAVKTSSKVQFKELNDLVPSTLSTYIFNVPDGKHVYEFKEVESAAPELAVRFKISKAAMGILQ
jgi:hypothetical protein